MAGLLAFTNIAMLTLAVFLFKKFLSKKSAPLPPGPPKLPVLRNLLDMPSSHEWLTFAKWGEKWGDIVSVSVFGQQIIILNSAKHASEMLYKRSTIYSDRPIITMAAELVGWKSILVLTPSGERFRNIRRLFHQAIGTQAAVSEFYPMMELETRRFLQRILAKPDDLAAHVRKTVGAVVLRISHGYEVQEEDDPFVNLADQAMDQFSLSTSLGGFLVNLIPTLRHLPAWFPGTGFKKTAAEWAITLTEMVERPHEFVKQQMASGTAETSFTSRLLDSSGTDITPAEENEIKWTALSLYAGGADTTVSAVYATFLARVLYPEAATKARAELDRVVGNDRLPNFADRVRLPYTNAFVLEVLRWHTITPTGAPHRATEDNMYEGYLIPKGAVVMANIWKMSHDPKIYSDPFEFKPERFLGPHPEPDSRDVCFGFGRRICPGRELAEASLFISVATSLAVLDIAKGTLNGLVTEPQYEQTAGTISHLKPFICSIKPRSERAAEIIVGEA